jgi:hypothetical protein
MVTVNIDETTTLGQHLLRELRQNPSAGAIYEQSRAEKHPFLEFVPHENDRINKIPRDADGNIIGYTWEEVRAEMYAILNAHYGADVRTV